MSADTPEFYDAFISYGRIDSQDFAKRLSQRLKEQNFNVWLDEMAIPKAENFSASIDVGIGKSYNFLFIISPRAVQSEHCSPEIKLALERNKRVITLMHVEEISRETWQSRNPDGTAEQWEDYKDKGLHSSRTNFTELYPELSKINWISFREGIDDFEKSFQDLLNIFHRHRDYVEQHTLFLTRALEWERQKKQTSCLLIGEERQQAEKWLQRRFRDEQPPCVPTLLHCEFICESIKNANNLMTQVFLAHAEVDGEITEKIRADLLRQGITVWISKQDIQTGEDFEAAIDRGIEQTDTVVYLLSPAALQSPYCQQELKHALELNKRIIPLLIQPTDLKQIPSTLSSLQRIDFTDNKTESDYQQDIDQLLHTLREDATYYEEHKILLVKALKWKQQRQNPCLLLRGYNLRHARAWLEVAKQRSQNAPTPLQETFINESQRQPPAASLDVFISYSRADSDLARRLNEGLQFHGKTTWFDQESIASGADFQQEIYRGIKSADNFLFILSPRSVNSPYCNDEVEYAAKLNKRFVTVLCQKVKETELHPKLAKVQRIDFSPSGGDFSQNVGELLRTLETDREHVHDHTKWLLRALDWDDRGRNEDMLLRGSERVEAATWLQGAIEGNKKPVPTELQREFIEASSELYKREQARQKRSVMILRAISIVASSLAVMAGGLAVFAYGQQQYASKQERLANSQRDEARKQQKLADQERFKAEEALKVARQQREIAKKQGRRADEQAQNAKGQKQKAEEQATIAKSEQKRAEEQKIIAQSQRKVAEGEKNNAEINFQSATTQSLLDSNQDFEALLTGLKTAQKLKSLSLLPDTRMRAIATLQQAVYSRYEKNRLEGHTETVNSVSYSPDGQTIVSASDDKKIKLWNSQGQVLKIIKGHKAHVNSVSFSPDGQTIASASDDSTIKLWNLQGKELRTLEGHKRGKAVRSVSFSPDGKMIASASNDATVKLWNLQGKELHTIVNVSYSRILSVAFSPDSKKIAFSDEKGNIQISNLQGKEVRTFKGSTEGKAVRSVSFSPDGTILAFASDDWTIKLLHLQSWKLLQTLNGHRDSVYSVSFSADGKLIASASNDNTVKIWNLQGKELQTLSHSSSVRSVSFSSISQLNGISRTVVSSSDDGTIKIWDLQARGLQTLEHNEAINSVSFSPDGKMIASASNDGTIKLWNLQKQELIKLLTGHSKAINSASFSPDGKMIASASDDTTIKLWNLQRQELQTFKGHTGGVNSVSFSPDGKMIASASKDKTIKLWNLQGQKPKTFKGHTGGVNSVSFSPDGKMIASASDDGTVKLWNLQGQELKTFKGHSRIVWGASFSPDGKTIASASNDGTVKLWNLQGQELKTFKGHSSYVVSVSFSPDGKTIASASNDKTVILWNLEGQILYTFKGHSSYVYSVSFSPNGKTLASAGDDGKVILWNLDLDVLLQRGCARLHDYLTYNPNGKKERQVCTGINQSSL